MLQLEKCLIWFLLNILKSNFATCDWFCADGSHICYWNEVSCFSVAGLSWDLPHTSFLPSKSSSNSLFLVGFHGFGDVGASSPGG